MLHVRTAVVVLVLVGSVLMACAAPTGVFLSVPEPASPRADDTASAPMIEAFRRIPADKEMSPGTSVAKDCQDAGASYPYQPYDWPDASATLELQQSDGRSTVAIEVSNAKPETYYTVWVRLKGKDANGEAYGGSPLTGAPGTALAPTSELGNLLAAMGPGHGNTNNPNGFFTDKDGNGTFKIELDFPIINGAYPFQKFAGFDPKDERFPLDNPRIMPVPIIGSGAPFTIRVASHCTDGVGHGLVPGPHEGWFDWSY